jgi:hypothetical protein
MTSNSPRKSTMKSPIFVTAVSMTQLLQKTIPYFCVKGMGKVQDNLPKNVFSIDIPFNGSQSHSNMRPKVTAVSMTPLCNSQRCQ